MLSLKDLKDKMVVLYFYPKDMTPGCTTEAQDFRDCAEAFKKAGTIVVGVSKDSVKRHDNFKAKHDLNFALVSDEDGRLCEDYGVWQKKKLATKTKYISLQFHMSDFIARYGDESCPPGGRHLVGNEIVRTWK